MDLHVVGIDRFSLKMPYHAIVARNMDRELPHLDIFCTSLPDGNLSGHEDKESLSADYADGRRLVVHLRKSASSADESLCLGRNRAIETVVHSRTGIWASIEWRHVSSISRSVRVFSGMAPARLRVSPTSSFKL